MGYGDDMTKDLEKKIDNADFDLVNSALPIGFTRVVKLKKLMQRVAYEL
jgi:predicted GTPase